MEDRGMIKWQPFNSVTPSSTVIKSLILEKSKIPKPILSDEEKKEIEEKIIEAFYCGTDVTLHYYKNGYIKTITGKIKKIDHISKTIYLNNTIFLFNQIISIC